MMKERSNQKAMSEENAREGQEQWAEKKPYETPELQRLGSVKEMTQGTYIAPGPDIADASY